MAKRIPFVFQGYKLMLTCEKYEFYNNTALLLETEDGIPFGVASANVVKLPADLVAIKDYSENEGMFDALYNQKIISAPVRYIDSGFIKMPVCKIIMKELLEDEESDEQ